MFCSKFNINFCFASPAHPQSNGQVEAINKIIKRTLKTSLDKAKGCWLEFVPQVLWLYRTSYRTSTRETPFSLAFGTEAVVPVELEQAKFRVQNYVQSENDKQLTLNLDLVEEHRNQAHLRNVAYKQRISNYYDSRVKPRSFKVEDWVLKKNYSATESRVKEHLVQTGMDRLKLLASVALAPTSLKAPMARPLAIHGKLIT
ncbi:hypothetical protein ACFXTO_026013 [Malus domestica]